MSAHRRVHLVGSVPLSSGEEVFRLLAETLGLTVRRFPDGETGRRRNWINFQYAYLVNHPQLEPEAPVDPEALVAERSGQGSDYARPALIRLRQGVSGADLRFEDLGYAAAARESFATFRSLKDAGVIPAGCRFQVSLPTPLAPIAAFVSPEHMPDVLPAYAAGLLGELDEMTRSIAADDLAVQWDVAVELGLWEGVFPPPPGDWKTRLLDELAALGKAVPERVDLGYHLCYGDRGHKHFVEPMDTGNLVTIANGVQARLRQSDRTLDFLHLPVPRDRSDPAYFAPLAGLELGNRTELYLGLVHLTDGVEGTRRRMAAAEEVVKEFGIATECGMGRRDPATIPDLLRIHATCAAG